MATLHVQPLEHNTSGGYSDRVSSQFGAVYHGIVTVSSPGTLVLSGTTVSADITTDGADGSLILVPVA